MEEWHSPHQCDLGSLPDPPSYEGFPPRTGGSVGWASGCHAGGRELDSDRTNTQGLKITEEKVPPL